MQRVSPNQDKESGILMYAATSADGTMYPSWTSFRANRTNPLTRYFSWIEYTDLDDVYRNNLQPATGAYNPEDGKYYLMLTFVYDCIWNYKQSFNYIPQKWFSIDLANGATKAVEIADLREYSKEQGWLTYSTDANAPHWGLWMDMSFDPIEGTMYALAQSEQTITDDNPYHSAIVQVNLTNGNYRVKKELTGRYYLGFTYDLDGKLYAARWTTDASNKINGSVIVELDRESFAEIRTVTELKKYGDPFQLCYNATMDVDRATGEIYFVGADFNGGHQSLFKINTKTGESTYLSGFSYDNVVGLHIPYVGTEHRNAPARVSNLRTEFAPDGANSITIKWTNPTTKWNLEDLTSMDGVKIYRDDMNGEPIAVVKDNAAPGAEASYVDDKATPGLHTYYVIPYNENGDGISDSIAAFVGKDTPDAPVNVDGYGSGTFSMVYWEAPKTGLHDGWFDDTSLKYTVTRSDGTVIAEDITDTQVYDTKLDDAPMMLYSYTVTASNADGLGGSAESQSWLAGAAYKAPCTFDFVANPSDVGAFTGYNPSAGYTSWTSDNYWRYAWILEITSTSKYDEYLFSPQIDMKAGHTYRLRWNMEFEQNCNIHSFEMTYGTKEDEQTVIAEKEFDETATGAVQQTTQFVDEFTVTEDGKYLLGLHVTSENAQWDYIRVKGLVVEEVLGTDLQAKSITGFPRINRAKEQNYLVSVYNSGKNDVSGFKVEAGYTNRKGEFVALGETTYSGTLAGGETKQVSVPVIADYESGTQFDLCARVIAEGDEYAGNDICDATSITVEEIEGADGFNAEFIGSKLSSGDGYGDTNVPFTTFSPNTTSVTIYPASMLVTDKAAPYEITRIGYTAYSKIQLAPCDVKVYIGTTDDEMFTGDPVSNVISPSDLELVYEGKTTAMFTGPDGISINFDTPYLYDGNKNLVVALETVCNTGNGNWYINWNTWDREVGRYQSLKTNAVEWKPADAAKWDGMPDLHLALKSFVGIDGINADAAFGLALNGRTVLINGNAEALRVYDLAGRLLGAYNVKGLSQMTLNVPDGIYLIKAVDAAGNARALKAAVR